MLLIMDIVVKRKEANLLSDRWALVYGRRKVGKTFMLKRFYSWDYFILVGRDGTLWVEGADIEKFSNIEDFIRFVIRSLRMGKRVVIDEFQRLPDYVLERISTTHPSGILILSGSSMRVVKDIFGTKSPLLGLIEEHPVGLINPQDMIKSLYSKKFLDYVVYLRDPWLIPLMNGDSILKDLYRVMTITPSTIPSLVGEIFREEDRRLTSTYEGIIKSIGSGYGKPSDISSILYSRGLIPKDSASGVVPYIKNLVKMGILKEVKLYGKKGIIYRMVSPIFSVFYYLSDKYEMEYSGPSFEIMKENIMRIHSLCYEDFVAEVIADILGGYLRYSHDPEIDGIIVDRKEKPIAVVEVKYGKIGRNDISKFVDKTENIRGKRIIVAKNRIDYKDVTVLTPDKFKNTVMRWKI